MKFLFSVLVPEDQKKNKHIKERSVEKEVQHVFWNFLKHSDCIC